MIFGEGSVLDDGRQVIAPWKKRGAWIGNIFYDGPQIRMPDAALDAKGRAWVVGKGQEAGAFVLCESEGIWWSVPRPIFGTRMILRPDGDGCRIAFTTGPAAWSCLAVKDDGSIQSVSTGPVADGSGGNGMRDWDAAGNPRTLEPLDAPLLGRPTRAAISAGGVTIAAALGGQDQVLMAKAGVLGTLTLGLVPWQALRLSSSGKYWIGTNYLGATMVGGPVPAVPPPLAQDQIGRPCWLGFINFIPADTPGNCRVNVSDMIVRDDRGAPVAIFVEGKPDGDLAAINRSIAEAKQVGLPILAYWPRGIQAGPLPTGCDVVGVEAYRGLAETRADFESRVTAAVKRAPKAALICQAYSNNVALTTDLASLPPIYARIAKAQPNVWGLLAFSGSGRVSGLQDHPEIRPLWEAVAAGIPRAPEIEEPMPAPKITVTRFDGLIREGWECDWTDGDRKYSLKVKDKSLVIAAKNAQGGDQTGSRRQVLP